MDYLLLHSCALTPMSFYKSSREHDDAHTDEYTWGASGIISHFPRFRDHRVAHKIFYTQLEISQKRLCSASSVIFLSIRMTYHTVRPQPKALKGSEALITTPLGNHGEKTHDRTVLYSERLNARHRQKQYNTEQLNYKYPQRRASFFRASPAFMSPRTSLSSGTT